MKIFDRKRPIHIQPIILDNMPVILFLTICSKNKRNIFNNNKFHLAAKKAWKKADYWKCGYYMIMPDHIHFFITPNQLPIYNLKNWVVYWKRLVTTEYEKQMNSCKNIWEKDFWDTQMRTRDHYMRKLNYALQNPVTKKMVDNTEDWPYQGYINDNLL